MRKDKFVKRCGKYEIWKWKAGQQVKGKIRYIWQTSKQDSYVGMICSIIKTEAMIFNGWLVRQKWGKRDH